MKNRATHLLASVIFVLSFISCSPDLDNFQSTETVDQMLVRASWNVEMTVDQSTSINYSGYTLLFDSRGTAMLVRTAEQHTGNWQNANETVNLEFQSTDPDVTSLNKDWRVSAKNSRSINFVSISQPNYALTLTMQ